MAQPTGWSSYFRVRSPTKDTSPKTLPDPLSSHAHFARSPLSPDDNSQAWKSQPYVKNETPPGLFDAQRHRGHSPDSLLHQMKQSSLEEPRSDVAQANLVSISGSISKPPKRERGRDERAENGSDSESKRARRSPKQAPQPDRGPPMSRPKICGTTSVSAPLSPGVAKHTPQSFQSPTDVSKDDGLFRQPDTRPITEQQLVQEVKGIYAGLVMVEKKCTEIVQQQSQSTTKLSDEQWQALIALHRTLLHEHHDFFSASQHPTASAALRRLATKYAMPARMWRHGIHAFLELLRHRLPDSLDHMLSFVYLAYSNMALLMESVPSFVETWIECLGDLARYRMAIEESDLRDREIWSNVARMWYNKAADLSPNVGRIQHHLAVLARPNIVQQLFYYSKALVSVTPFLNARESIMLLFTPLLEETNLLHPRYSIVESSIVTAAGVLFTKGVVNDFRTHFEQFKSNFDSHLARTSTKFKVQGPEIASSLFAMIMDFGSGDNPLWTFFIMHAKGLISTECKRKAMATADVPQTYVVTDPILKQEFQQAYWDALKFESPTKRLPPINTVKDEQIRSSEEVSALVGPVLFDTISAAAGRLGDKNTIPFMHFVLATLWGMSFVPEALPYVEACVPWQLIASFLNTLGRSSISYANVESEGFPQSYGGTGRQLPEDFAMRGLIAMQYYFPPDWFTVQVVDEDERLLEHPSHQAPRTERCLWCGVRLATLSRYLLYSYETKQFDVTPFAASLRTQLETEKAFSSSNTFTAESLSSQMEVDIGVA